MRAVISVGANAGDARAQVQAAMDHFAPHTLATSGLYITPPWGKRDQAEFINAVLIVHTETNPAGLLRECQELEEAAGRRRSVRWGPRSLDVDIVQIVCDNAEGTEAQEVLSDEPSLILPHPWAHARAFVLVPWLSIDPDARLRGQPISELIAALPPEEVAGIRRI